MVRFRNPDAKTSAKETSSSVAEEKSETDYVVLNPGAYASLSIQQQRRRLPIFENRNHVIFSLEQYQTLVLVGETGCGKSTQIPQFLLEAGWCDDGGSIGVCEPRRMSAVMLASRVADERGAILGMEVGYSVRFDHFCDETQTKIKFMTDGMLLREVIHDPLLSKYSVIMVDEAHERGMNTDIIVGLLRKIILKRPDLKIVIASATLDAELFCRYFETNKSDDKSKNTATIMSIKGRMYPIDIFYAKVPVPDYVASAVEMVMRIHKSEGIGDVIVFLTGQDEVHRAVKMLREEARSINRQKLDALLVLPMYGALPQSEQLKIFDSTAAGSRKAVIATNIAETSVTIPGIVFVVDSGFVRIRAIDKTSGIESLVTVAVSQASANQRAGRAGRLRSGKAYRLYTEDQFLKLPLNSVPEMQRSDVAYVILQLKILGISNVLRFNFLSPPSSFAMTRGLELLFALGALNEDGNLVSPTGACMAESPLSPMHSKVLLSAGKFGCAEEILSILAMMQVGDPFVVPTGKKTVAERSKYEFSTEEGDHVTLLNVFTAFVKAGKSSRWCGEHFLNYRSMSRAVEIREQLRKYLIKYEIPIESCRGDSDSVESILKCLVAGLFANAAQLHYSGVYHTIRGGHQLAMHKGSVLCFRTKYPDYVIFNEVMQDSMRVVSAIDGNWLRELAPHFYEFGSISNPKKSKLV